MAIDPAAFSKLVKIYQNRLDDLILNLGKPVEIHFYPTVTTPNSNFYDPIHGGSKQPKYKGSNGNLYPIITENTKIILALTSTDPTQWNDFGNIKVQEGTQIVRLKTYLTDVDDLLRCHHIIPNLDAKLRNDLKFRLLRQPVPKGLQQNRYAISYWGSF